ncbi:MAG: addiction module protein [Gemmataceae bacterium]
MSEAAKKALELALQLQPAERQWLADELLDRLDQEPMSQDELDEYTSRPEFVAMIERRLAEHDANPDAAIPWDVAMRQLREELQKRTNGQ